MAGIAIEFLETGGDSVGTILCVSKNILLHDQGKTYYSIINYFNALGRVMYNHDVCDGACYDIFAV